MKRITATEERMMEKEAQKGSGLIDQLARIEKMLRYAVICLQNSSMYDPMNSLLNGKWTHTLPDISDIIKKSGK